MSRSRIHVGTSGWTYDDWSGAFYPDDVKGPKRLAFYASRFDAVEFRHPSWWDEEVVALLSRHKAAFVAVSHPKLPDTIHATADWLYVRFHGLGRQLYRYDYSREELQGWAERLAPHLAGRTLYAFFNNDYEYNAPRNAATFRELLGR